MSVNKITNRNTRVIQRITGIREETKLDQAIASYLSFVVFYLNGRFQIQFCLISVPLYLQELWQNSYNPACCAPINRARHGWVGSSTCACPQPTPQASLSKPQQGGLRPCMLRAQLSLGEYRALEGTAFSLSSLHSPLLSIDGGGGGEKKTEGGKMRLATPMSLWLELKHVFKYLLFDWAVPGKWIKVI